MIKAYEKFEFVRPSIMVIIRIINYHIIIHPPSKLGVYQYEAKKLRALTIGKCFLGQNQTKKTDKIEVHVSPSTLVIFLNLPDVQSNGRWL